jgi:regulator of RNase E activity RraA/CMP-N-acetylneuraminic acid synthetase
MNQKVALFIPAKEHSERIVNKNLKILDGEYLFRRKILQLLKCKQVHEIWLDSDSKEMHELTKHLPIKHLDRDPSLATNKTDGHLLFANEAKYTDADIVVQVLCTAPFLDSNTVDDAIKKFIESDHSSMVAITKNKFYEWEKGEPVYGDAIPNSKDLPEKIVETMSLYAVKRNTNPITRRYLPDPLLYELAPLQSIDIDNKEDFQLAETICAGQRSLEVQQMTALGRILTTSIVSDVCKELNIPHFLSKKIRSLNSGRFIGRAKTLKIKNIENNSKEWRGIFDALKSYEFLVPGDVIVVSTDVPDKAYFGDVNSSFALRRGVVGAVIDGYTRDIDKITQMQLPIFAHGSRADDVRYKGTLESYNLPITINDIVIQNNDIMIADSDGVVVVPQHLWITVLEKSQNAIETEQKIKIQAIFGADPFEILKKHGDF